MSIVFGAFVGERRSHLLLLVNQFQSQVDHLAIILTTHFDGVSLFDLLDKVIVLIKDNVCLVKASIKVAKNIIGSKILSISDQRNVHAVFDDCSFDNNCLASLFGYQFSLVSSFTTESNLDGVITDNHLFLADLVESGGLVGFGLKQGFHQVAI